jgi:hypothetical protein
MNHCPLIGKDCIGNNCQLWLKTIQRESCSIELISYYLVQMSDSLDKISKDLAGKSTS